MYNDKFHWPEILATPSAGEIYHMDYSKNLSQMYEFELQSNHFNKKQRSIHCTVKPSHDRETPSYDYVYHLSNGMNYNHVITTAVVENFLQDCDIEQTIFSVR